MFHAALDLGAKGYVLKDSAIDDIVTAITEAVAGRIIYQSADDDLFFAAAKL